MRHLFSEAGLARFREFAAPGTLLAFDYDGTLTPICDDPAEAALPSAVARHLQGVAQAWPTVIITGRAGADVQRFLDGLQEVAVIGNHGAETSALLPPFLKARVAGWRDKLEHTLQSLPGLVLEDKGYSLSLHYRRSPDWAAAHRAIMQAMADLPDARTVGGKAVINVVLPEAPDKGTALLWACRRNGCRRAIYVGDDDTDEDVFRLDRPDEVLGICVGSERPTHAEYYLSDTGEVGELLRLLDRAGTVLAAGPRYREPH
jgi:trehalose 6-phosphate phosphatase